MAEVSIALLPSGTRHTAVVLGGGVGGLTAAHELAERGFDVTVIESSELGGRSRSIGVPGTGANGRRDLPGEHGFRYFPGFYHHLPDTMRRIPYPGNPDGVFGNLVPTNGVWFARNGGRDTLTIAVPEQRTPAALGRMLWQIRAAITAVPGHEGRVFARRLAIFLASCEERRLAEWEQAGWWDFVRAGRMSGEYRELLATGLTRHLAAAKPELASARTIGSLGEAYLCTLMGRGKERAIGSVLNGPTSEAWIGPWVAHLRALGVRFETGWSAEELELAGRRVAAVVTRGPGGEQRRLAADWFVCALPARACLRLWNRDVLAADPHLAKMTGLRTETMSGIQFYLRRRVPLLRGFIHYVQSPWALVSVSQAQFWSGRQFTRDYGDGTVEDCMSVNVAAWDTPGILFGKPAARCTRDEIAQEVWAQVRAGLGSAMPEGIVHSWFLDPAIGPGDDGPSANSAEPVVVATAGSWASRPDAATAIGNLFLAADYVRTAIDLPTMEGANEAGRRAVNALLAAARLPAPRCAIYARYQPFELAVLQWLDRRRFRRGRPHLLDRRSARPARTGSTASA
jgi:uncharacterized protein with NAD-binding domain and iron-sulfur cluster